jgi:hypothetical protein
MVEYKKAKGQSLVEMAVILPLLILMFIGVVEVGWAILGYHFLLGNSRELARFSTRQDVAGNWRDDSNKAFQMVASHYDTINTRQFSTTIILHHYEIFTGIVCQDGGCWADCSMPETSDDYKNHEVFQNDFNKISRINDELISQQLAASDFVINCERQLIYIENCLKYRSLDICKEEVDGVTWRSELPSTTITVELFYDQPQVTGFYWFLNPVPLRAYTTMKAPRLIR